LTVTAGCVIRSPAFRPCWPGGPTPRNPPLPGGNPSPQPPWARARRSASETTPITFSSSSTTGKALTRNRRSRAAISLNEALRFTATTWAVMTSFTVAFIVLCLPLLGLVRASVGREHDAWVVVRILPRRIAEAVAYRHHALDVPGLVHDLVADRFGLRRTSQGYHAVLHRHAQPVRVTEDLVKQDLGVDFPPDIFVRAIEDRQHVGPAEDPGQMTIGVDDGKPLDLVRVHQPRGVLDCVLEADGHRGGCHQVARRYPARLLQILVVQEVVNHSRQAVALVAEGFLGQHVGLGDDPDHF